MHHAVGSLAVLGSGVWSLVSLFRGAGVGCWVVVYGRGLGMELYRNILLYSILGLQDKSNNVSFLVRCCVLGLEIYCLRAYVHLLAEATVKTGEI